MAVTIITNRHWYDLVYYRDLPEKAREEFASDYEQVTNGGNYDDSPLYFRYKGDWFSMDRFARISVNAVGFEHAVTEDSPLAGWSGISHGTYDSGWLVRSPTTRDECDYHSDQVQGARFY